MQSRKLCYVMLCFALFGKQTPSIWLSLGQCWQICRHILVPRGRAPFEKGARPLGTNAFGTRWRRKKIAYTKYVSKKSLKLRGLHKVSTWLLLQHILTRPQESGDFASTAKSMYHWEHTESILISITTNQKASGIKSNLQTRKGAPKVKHWIMRVAWTMKARHGVEPEMTARNLTMKQDRHQVSKHIDRLEAIYITFNKDKFH